MKKEDWKKKTAGMASTLNGLLSSLSEYIAFVYDNEVDFLKEFGEGDHGVGGYLELEEVVFGSEHIRIFYLRENKLVTNTIDIEKFIDWAAR